MSAENREIADRLSNTDLSREAIEQALDEAEKRGAVWMREKAAKKVSEYRCHVSWRVLDKAIRSLPTDKESENV